MANNTNTFDIDSELATNNIESDIVQEYDIESEINVGGQGVIIGYDENVFITDEYNKTVNLLPLRPDGIYNNSGTVMTISGDTISMYATNSIDSGSAFYLSGVNNEVKLKSGHTYTLKAFDVTGATGNNLITGSVRKSDGTTANDYIYFYFPNTSTTFTLTEDVTLKGVSFYTVAGKAFDCSFKMGLFEDDNPTIYYPYNGELVNEKEITKDVIYDKDSEHWEINKGYTSGIMSTGENSGGISFPALNLNSYKALLITARLDGVFKTVRVPLIKGVFAWNIISNDIRSNKTAYNYFSGYVRYSENIIRFVFAGIVYPVTSEASNKDNNSDYIITKIEGVK